MNNPVLETERLIIKKGKIEDYVKIHEYDFNKLQNIKGIFEYVRIDPDEVRNWFDNDIKAWYKKVEEQNHYYFVVYLKEDLSPIADIGLDRNNPELNSLEFSIWQHPNYWGCGYMMEALIEIMAYIFDQGFDNIIYGHVEGNERSKKLCRKLGFSLYKVNKDSFNTNEGLVTEFKYIMSKEEFYQIYKKEGKTTYLISR